MGTKITENSRSMVCGGNQTKNREQIRRFCDQYACQYKIRSYCSVFDEIVRMVNAIATYLFTAILFQHGWVRQ